MKKTIIILLVIALVIVAVILIIRNSALDTLDEQSDFAVQDTGSITKIFLTDKKNNNVLLVKKAPGEWTVNEKYNASRDMILIFLKTLMNIEMQSPVPRGAHNNIVKVLATTATKVEIYQTVYWIDLFDKIRLFPHEKCTKTYYVGPATQNNLASYMIMQQADEPFIVGIPGFRGYVSTRYSTHEKDWRDHSVFHYRYMEIKSVMLRFPETPEQSFKLVKKGQRDFNLYQLSGNSANIAGEVSGYDTLRVMNYLTAFENIRYEELIDNLSKGALDSIINAVPYQILTVEDAAGKLNTIKTFRMKAEPVSVDLEGRPVLWDRDRMYALINDGKDLVLVQFFVFDPILRPMEYFLNKSKAGQAKNDL